MPTKSTKSTKSTEPPTAPSQPSSGWILPGRVINPVMQQKAILETSLAFSRTFNTRNIEFHWYALWAQTLSDLVGDLTNLIVAPQFPVWFVPMHDDHEGEDDGDDPEEIAELPEELPEELPKAPEQNAPGYQAKADDEEVGCGAGDVSFASTVPEKDADQVVVDFVILHLKAVAQPQQRARYGGWRITEANIVILVEVKRFVSRSLKGEEQEEEIRGEISEARNDLINQAAHVFIQDSNKDYVLAIAALGPYWCSTTIHRTEVRKTMHVIFAKDPSYRAPNEKPIDDRLKWNKVVRVDRASSRNRLKTIYNNLKAMGGLETPVDV